MVSLLESSGDLPARKFCPNCAYLEFAVNVAESDSQRHTQTAFDPGFAGNDDTAFRPRRLLQAKTIQDYNFSFAVKQVDRFQGGAWECSEPQQDRSYTRLARGHG